jgi:N-methylhydantoinase A
VPVEALNWRVTVAGPAPALDVGGGGATGGSAAAAAVKGQRPAFFPETSGYVPTPVYDRYALGPGAELAGPAIVEERESTTVLGPGARCRVADDLTLVVEIPR